MLPQHPRAHPCVIALAEHVTVAILASCVVGVGQGAEVEQPPLLGALARGNGHRAGYAAEQHGDAFIRHLVDVGNGLFGAGCGIAADQA